ncbi:MAG TPA: DUF4282 domain-containing protein [Candidatus Limnocylindrales bacterium]|jgi:hypothetical protein|nr:DUF4282 domain-containing protein [Candidatus Limnocylindrales bacterium]
MDETRGEARPSGPPSAWPATPGRPDGGGGFSVGDFVTFRYLITPGFITVIYVLGAIVITLAALAAAAQPGQGGLVAAVFVFLGGQLWWRIVLEFVMVLFRIQDHLASIDRRGRGM